MTTAQYLTASKVGKKTRQIILVKDHSLTVWNKSGGTWKQGSVKSYCGYGRNGLKAASKRYAGDKTTPIGAWPLTLAFGRGSNPGAKMKYRRITKNSYWACTRSQYNTWVESKSYVPGEHLIDYYQYKYAMVIGFNMNPTVYGKGSGIFLHCKSTDRWWTAGCVSVPDGVMLDLMKTTGSGRTGRESCITPLRLFFLFHLSEYGAGICLSDRIIPDIVLVFGFFCRDQFHGLSMPLDDQLLGLDTDPGLRRD